MKTDEYGVGVFAELEARLAQGDPKDQLGFKRDRVVIALMLLGVALTVPSMLGINGEWAAWITWAGLLLELCGLGVLSYRQVRDVAPELKDAKRKFAVELDERFIGNQEILVWLRSLPRPELDCRLVYIDSRLQSMSQRYLVVFGAVDKLGLLPILVGVFVQWQAIERVSIAVGAFAIFIFVMYGMAIWMVRFRLQMQSYARLLNEAKSSN